MRVHNVEVRASLMRLLNMASLEYVARRPMTIKEVLEANVPYGTVYGAACRNLIAGRLRGAPTLPYSEFVSKLDRGIDSRYLVEDVVLQVARNGRWFVDFAGNRVLMELFRHSRYECNLIALLDHFANRGTMAAAVVAGMEQGLMEAWAVEPIELPGWKVAAGVGLEPGGLQRTVAKCATSDRRKIRVRLTVHGRRYVPVL